MKLSFALCGLIAASSLLCLALRAEAAKVDAPHIFLADPERVAGVRARMEKGDTNFKMALANLQEDADKALQFKPVSVLDKAVTPPSGDKHDYMSQSIYWWPDPTKPDGLPYIRRDGEINPESKKITDERNLLALSRAVEALAQAYYFTGNQAYAAHAARLLKTWFLNPATRMNPHLNYAQGTPGRNTGRYSGIVDGESFIRIVDSVGLLQDTKDWTKADNAALQKWFGQYADWLTNSEFGKKEAAEHNNHATVYDVQLAISALYAGKKDVAKRVLSEAKTRRIAVLIEPDGSQPSELARTKAWTYSMKNLQALFWLASLGDRVGVDLWHYQSRDGRSLRKAVDFLLPYAAEEKKWPYPELSKLGSAWKPTGFQSFLRRAALKFPEPRYEAVLQTIDPKIQDSKLNLLWPAK